MNSENKKELQVKCDEKWVMVMQRVRILKPFYYAVFTNLPKVGYDDDNALAEYSALGLAVTGKELLYNRHFLSEVEVENLLFFTLHEIVHYALMHIERKNRVKHPLLYNIAADLYVNAILKEEYRLIPGGCIRNNSVKIGMPIDKIIYDDRLKIDDLCVEDIYEMLLRYGMKQDKESGTSSVQVGTKEEPIPSEENIIKKLQDFQMSLEGLSGDAQKLISMASDLINSVTIDSEGEVSSVNNEQLSAEDSNALETTIRASIIEAITDFKLAGNTSGCLLEEYVNKVLAPKVDWKKLVRKFLVQMTAKESSYSTVDRRTLWHECILPGQSTPDISMLENVKMCTDTSGSISKEELEIFYAQLAQLCNEYKVTGELIHWDSECEVMGDINSNKELYGIGKVYGGGGTNPACLFRYFDSKQCKKKPGVIIILTDGFINFTNEKNWSSRYGKKTIWVINKCGNKKFEAPFGTVCNLANH